ncbi:MAG TPA: hypothetical protein VGM23_12995, partial [Armatimonadota bacterium]
MTRYRHYLLLLAIGCLAFMMSRLLDTFRPPASWRQLQHWAATARPGDLYRGNKEFSTNDGRQWTPLHTQTEPIKFLFSDNPEYLYNDAVGKGLAAMRLTRDAAYRQNPAKSLKFGVGLMHINMTRDSAGKPQAQTLRIVASLARKMDDCSNGDKATVSIDKGAYGLSDDVEAIAGRKCAVSWFGTPNVAPVTRTIAPGETQVLFASTLR